MTMASTPDLRSVPVGPQRAGQANSSPEGLPLYGTCVGGCCWGRGGYSGLARGAFPVHLCSPIVHCCTGSCASPSWMVLGKRLPFAGVNVQVFEGHFKAVLQSLLLPPDCALALTKFGIQHLFWQSTARHSNNMTCPPGLSFLEEGVDAENAGLFQDLCVWDFVPPPNMKESVETTQVKMIELLGMSAVDSPGLAL